LFSSSVYFTSKYACIIIILIIIPACRPQIDPEVMRNTALVLSWLRLVQAARSRDEQNTEAHLEGGQLYVRATRDIGPEEELLVWYDPELSHLLGFTEMARELHGGEKRPSVRS